MDDGWLYAPGMAERAAALWERAGRSPTERLARASRLPSPPLLPLCIFLLSLPGAKRPWREHRGRL